jgi:AAA domain
MQSHKLAKPPMATSPKLASQVLKHLQSNPRGSFREFNAPQRAAIEAALTRRMTLIQGPPGTGKTVVAAAIGFGFVHQCKCISEHTKVLACAFSNVGADNLAEALIQLGLKVVRVGKPAAVSESLWSYTLDAAIDRDVPAQKALQNAARATAQLAKLNRRQSRDRNSSSKSALSDRTLRDAATSAVKASIEASNVAATKALREADVIVSTSIGAADSRLLAACGVVTGIEISASSSGGKQVVPRPVDAAERVNAPDGLPPLSLPFVIVDEACQSVEPATLIPVIATNSCRSLVLLGDPCQLPPTVLSRESDTLSLSLMERLAATLPHPNVIPPLDSTVKDPTYLDALPIKQAVSLVRSRSSDGQQRSYRKVFSGSILLSIQYRMHPSIAALPSAVFYDGLLATPKFMRERRVFPRALNKLMPCGSPDLCVRLIDVGGRDNERQGTPTKYTRTLFSNSAASASSLLEQQTTYWNEAEAERVIALVKDLLSGGPDPSVQSVGIISPYNGQVQLIKSMIASDNQLRDLLLKAPVSIEVKSVDGYQGRERDVIIFSAVRSNRQDRIGFLHDWRRMNVALTRAKSALLVVGDLDTLSSANKHWDALKKWAYGVRCVVNDYDCPDDEASL